MPHLRTPTLALTFAMMVSPCFATPFIGNTAQQPIYTVKIIKPDNQFTSIERVQIYLGQQTANNQCRLNRYPQVESTDNSIRTSKSYTISSNMLQQLKANEYTGHSPRSSPPCFQYRVVANGHTYALKSVTVTWNKTSKQYELITGESNIASLTLSK